MNQKEKTQPNKQKSIKPQQTKPRKRPVSSQSLKDESLRAEKLRAERLPEWEQSVKTPSAETDKASEAMSRQKKLLKLFSTRLVLLGVALILLLSSVIYLTTAWYTKMVSVSGMKFEVAKWDFSANFAVSDFKINIYEYSTLLPDRAAPGTGGVVPIELSASQAQTKIEYTIKVDRSTMSTDFRERIFFYYYDEDDTEKEEKIYFDGKPGAPEDPDNYLNGTIDIGGTAIVEIYWEWIYTAPTNDEEIIAKWDEFDTLVGKNPKVYSNYMNAEVSIIGSQVEPKQSS